MSDVFVKLNYSGVQELLKSSAVQDMLNGCAERAMNTLPEGYETENRITDRAVTVIHAATPKARIENMRNNTLLKAMGAAKL